MKFETGVSHQTGQLRAVQVKMSGLLLRLILNHCLVLNFSCWTFKQSLTSDQRVQQLFTISSTLKFIVRTNENHFLDRETDNRSVRAHGIQSPIN